MKKKALKQRPNQKHKQKVRKGKTGTGTSGYQRARYVEAFTGSRPMPPGNQIDDALLGMALMSKSLSDLWRRKH